jgi:hypothetical protein
MEVEMNETQTRKGPDARLLLLIPAVMIIAKAGRHRRAMWESGPGREFRLPPRIESALEAWHARAHEASDKTEPDAPASA